MKNNLLLFVTIQGPVDNYIFYIIRMIIISKRCGMTAVRQNKQRDTIKSYFNLCRDASHRKDNAMHGILSHNQ